jgi:poly(3-hydroxybutyrate) depolymerase
VKRLVLSAAWALVSSGCDGCELPSQSVDRQDLMGVFERDGGVDGGIVGASPAAPGGSADAAAPSDVPAPVSRTPVTDTCVEESGEPNRDLRRTVGRPACRRGRILEHRDAAGAPRYACLFAPAELDAKGPLPLLVFFHPGHANPTVLRKATGLREKARDFDFGAGAGKGGYLILAPQGRAIFGEERGIVFDTEHVSSENVDVQTVDHFIDRIASEGIVDRRRVYTAGWGAGGEMAAFYASVRPDRIAAFATFASSAPRGRWTCPTPPPPGAIVYRACDAITSCERVETWLRDREVARAPTLALRLGAADVEEGHCAVNKCGEKVGTANHQRWPKSIEERILGFLSGHTLSLNDAERP